MDYSLLKLGNYDNLFDMLHSFLHEIEYDAMEKGSEDGIIKLSMQHKCAAHTLNLVASAEMEDRSMPGAFRKP